MAGELGARDRRARTLRSVATALGIPASEIDDAEADGTLGLRIVEHTVGEPLVYTYEDLAERSGLGEEARRYWRALGFPDPEPGERLYGESDLEAMELLGTMLQLGLLEDDVALQLARVIGSSMQRVALSQIDAIEARIDDETPTDDRYGGGEALAVERARMLLPTVPRMLEYTWRRHLQSAARRRMVREHLATHEDGVGEARGRAIGFADLVNFVLLSQEVDDPTLAALVHRFESTAYDVVARHGGRVVKMIGDEVMFEVRGPGSAVEIGLDLADAFHEDDVLSDIRVGIAYGPALAREGDLFGPTVNLASRLVAIAYAGSVVVADEVRAALDGDERFRFKSLRSRSLKHIGRVQLHNVRRAGDPDERMAERARQRRGAVRARVSGLVEKNLPTIAGVVGVGATDEDE